MCLEELVELEKLVLDTILTKLGPKNAAVLACVSTRLRASVSDDPFWRAFCSQDLGLPAPLDPDGNPCPSFKVAYGSWRKSFSMYPWKLVVRAKKCWDSIKNWMAANFPEAGETLRRGAFEAELNAVERYLDVKLPLPTRVLYRLCDGQDVSGREHLFPLGIIGGYWFNGHRVNVHLLPLREIWRRTRECDSDLDHSVRSGGIIVAQSYANGKSFCLNCVDGQLYVRTTLLSIDEDKFPCVPHALIREVHDSDSDTQQDAILLWLEEHARCLQNGLFRLRTFNGHQLICLFPETAPLCTVAVANGVQIRASALFIPEQSLVIGVYSSYGFAYSIRMSLLPEGCIQDGTHYDSCQLESQHCIIRANDNVVSHVHGEGVIGKFPLLFPGKEEFVYESSALLPTSSGFIEGSFTFVPGSLEDPKGRRFKVKVARIPLEVPSYIF